MAIRKWHVGKVILLWAWGAIFCGIIILTIIGTKEWSPGPALGLILVTTLLLSVIKWKWFGGKEQ